MMSNVWYLQFNGSGFGPLTKEEVKVIIKSGRLKGNVLARGPGNPGWTNVDLIPQLSGFKQKIKIEEVQVIDKRSDPRVQLLAIVYFKFEDHEASGEKTYVGVCRDLSLGGMMVLSQVPAIQVSSFVSLDLVPQGEAPIEGFHVTGAIRSVLPGRNGFAVSFVDLPERAKIEIASYVESLKTT